jgi:hypothetical protein
MPSKPPIDEADRARIAVGNAIFAWASLEDKLVSLLGMVLGMAPAAPMASAIYFAPSNIETRLQIVDRAICERFNGHKIEQQFLDEWQAVLGKINRLKSTRNKIAHASLIKTSRPDREPVIRVTPQIYDIQRRRPADEAGQLQGMSPHDVEEHVKAIQSVIPIVEELGTLVRSSNGAQQPLLEILARLKRDRTS